MAPTPVRHPLREARDRAARRRSLAAHPAGRARTAVAPPASAVVVRVPARAPVVPRRLDDQAGSMTTEYGLIVVVGATIVSLIVKWASGGAVFELLNGVLEAAKNLVGF